MRSNVLRAVLLPFVTALFAFSPAHAQVGGSQASDPRVKQALDQDNWSYEVDEDGDYKLVVQFSNEDRSQLVWVISNTLTVNDIEVREIWSPVYVTENGSEVPASIARWALERSWDMKIGSLASDANGTVYFVAKIDANAPPDVLSSVIRTASSVGDELEKEKSTGDDL